MSYDLYTHLATFIEKYGNNLGIGECQLGIADYSFKSPQAMSNIIQIPTQFLGLIETTSNLILTNRNIFSDIGDMTKETNEPNTFILKENTFSLNDFLYQNELDTSTFNPIPKDEIRQEFATLLKYFINTFVLYHELGHVRQGNFDPTQKLSFKEEEIENGKDSRLDEQTMEVDADVFAINSLCQDLFTALPNFSRNGWTKNDTLKLALYSMFVFFYMSNNSDQIDDLAKDHPHPAVRFAIIANFIQVIFLENNFCFDLNDFKSLIKSVLVEFDKTLTHHFGLARNKSYYNLFLSEELKVVKNRIKENVPKIPCLSFNRSK